MSVPKIGEKTIAKEIRTVCHDGGGSSADRARVATGLIEKRVRRAYDVIGPLPIDLDAYVDAEAHLVAHIRDLCTDFKKGLAA